MPTILRAYMFKLYNYNSNYRKLQDLRARSNMFLDAISLKLEDLLIPSQLSIQSILPVFRLDKTVSLSFIVLDFTNTLAVLDGFIDCFGLFRRHYFVISSLQEL
jgi:hypothetical protein